MFSSHLPPVLLELPNELRQLLRHLRAEIFRHDLVLTGLVAKLVQEGAVGLGVGEPERGGERYGRSNHGSHTKAKEENEIVVSKHRITNIRQSIFPELWHRVNKDSEIRIHDYSLVLIVLVLLLGHEGLD